MKTIRFFLYFVLLVAFSQNSQAAKVQAKVCVAIASQTATAAKVQQTITLNNPSIPESTVMASYHQLTQAYVQGAREQSHALSNSLQNFAAMFTTSRMLWVLAALILLIFARM